jgi:thioesterase domain-containing protein
VLALQADGTHEPLFCIGGVHLYQSLADEFRRERPVFGLYVNPERNPGNGSASTRVDAMARIYAEEIRRIQPRGPYHLVGFSFGGVIAHAVAIGFLGAGESVDLLCLLDSDAPGHARPRLRLWVRRQLRRLLLRNARRQAPSEASPRHAEADSTNPAQAGGLIDERTLRRWMRQHRPGFFQGNVTFVEALAANLDASAGWHRLAENVSIRRLDSDHLELLRPPHTAAVATHIREALADGPSAAIVKVRAEAR